jgi:CRP-like cAMP-binding protein
MKTHHHFDVLKRCPFFLEVAQDVLWKVLDRADLRHFGARHTVFRAGDPSDGFYVVIDGQVAVNIADGNNSLQLNTVGPPLALGVIGAVDGGERTATAVTETECTLLFVSRATLEELSLVHSDLCKAVAVAVAHEARRVAEHESALLLSRSARLARWVLGAASTTGEVVATHERLALAVGTKRSVVSRIVLGWKAMGLVEVRRGGLRIVDREGMERQAS